MEPTIPIWQSKTFWVNLLTLIAGVLGMILGSDLIADYPQASALLVSIIGAVNIVLRFITDKAVSMLGGMRPKNSTKRF